MKRYQHYIDVRGEVLPTPRGTTTAVEGRFGVLDVCWILSVRP